MTHKSNLSKCGIYIIRNIVNRKVYIGRTTNSFSVRFSVHKKELRNGIHVNEYLQRDWFLFGEDSFMFEPIEYLHKGIDNFPQVEDKWIRKFFGINCYNKVKAIDDNLCDVYNSFLEEDSYATRKRISRKLTKNYVTRNSQGI